MLFLILTTFCVSLVSGQVSDPLYAGQPHCPDTYGLALDPHPLYCDKFYKCENGTLTLETCENGLLFDYGKGAVHNHCSYNWQVHCGDRESKHIVPLSSPGCEYQFGIYPKSACSTTYFKCAYGVPHETPCTPGLAYDEKNHACNWPDLLLDRGCQPEEITGFRCPDKVEPGTLAYKFWPYPRFAIGACEKLVTCVNGYPRLITCEPGAAVNPLSLTCENAAHVPKCEHLALKEIY